MLSRPWCDKEGASLLVYRALGMAGYDASGRKPGCWRCRED
jgi:hypothetical protein